RSMTSSWSVGSRRPRRRLNRWRADMASSFEVFLVTPEREVWSGQATIVIARGSEGEVGIQNGHAPMLIELGIGPLFIEPAEGERLAAAVDGGFLHVITADGATRVAVVAEHAGLHT